jgi:hypothetical protein
MSGNLSGKLITTNNLNNPQKTSPLSIKILEKPGDVLSRANASYSNLSKLDTKDVNSDYVEDYQGYKGYGVYKK